MARAVVFAYHNVGVRCLRALLARGVEVPLVVTHRDAPQETIWFDSVAAVAEEQGIAVITPEDPNTEVVLRRVAAAAPDFLFSFYYRHMLKEALLSLPPRGALNMHGSLLPKYRGRVPVNWAIIHGERETGASLHYMVVKPDAGDIVAQRPVPILPDDTAKEVFDKVTVAAELALYEALPALIGGSAPRTPQNLATGSCFGGRSAQDGEIDWRRDATSIHNLVRAVAPPYPGASTTLAGRRARVLRSRVLDPREPASLIPTLELLDGRLLARCGAGGLLQILALEVEGQSLPPEAFGRRFGAAPLALPG
ncbi:methionyl-tRNA formyltransferase [Burkholderiales bacterium]|nr:MAG: formyltransferase [Burkholderiales bacterium]CAG0998328.1 methionyl-tRNA formyltransferase [Burkholderiales bacterium]